MSKKIEYCQNSIIFIQRLFHPELSSSSSFHQYYLNFLNSFGKNNWICLNPIQDTIEFFKKHQLNYKKSHNDVVHEFLFYREIIEETKNNETFNDLIETVHWNAVDAALKLVLKNGKLIYQ